MFFQLFVFLLIAENTLGASQYSHSQYLDNPPNLDSAYGKGIVVDNLGGLKAYISGSFETSKPAILLVSDVYGFEAPNLRDLADKVAESGFYVVVPDFFYGDPMPANDSSQYFDWIKKHGTEKGFSDAKLVLQVLKENGSCALGVVGFCWGGKVAVELAKSYAIKAAVLLHPATVTVADIEEVKIPIEILEGELDPLNPPELVKQFEEVLSTKPEVPSYVKIFSGVGHGFSLRYDVTDREAVKKAEEAHTYMLNWLTDYVNRCSTKVTLAFEM